MVPKFGLFMEKRKFDIAVLGSGPGGYVAAIRAASQGAKVALIEAGEIGGTCLNRGCIPSKALIASAEVVRKVKNASSFGINVSGFSLDYATMTQRKDKTVERIRKSLEGLIAGHGVTIIRGFGKFTSDTELKVSGQEECFVEFAQCILATGSEPRPLPIAPFDGKLIHDSTSLLNLTTLPKRLIVIGGGVIGCEFASMHAELGVEVTILELLPTILPMEGRATAEALTAAFKKRGIKIETGVTVTQVDKGSASVKVHLKDGRTFDADMMLVSVGRAFNTDKIALEKTGVVVSQNGTVPINDHMQTNIHHIYAIGDITGKWILAHVASHQGIVAADHATGHHGTMNYRAVPSVIFTHPEIASVGLTLEKAKELGFEPATGKFPFAALGKSQATLETEGFAEVVIDKKSGEILGATVIGYGAATLIAEMALAIQNELTIDCVAETIHAHPTTAESWMEAAFVSIDMPIHLPPKRKSS